MLNQIIRNLTTAHVESWQIRVIVSNWFWKVFMYAPMKLILKFFILSFSLARIEAVKATRSTGKSSTDDALQMKY